jgi:XTP/dITP diphosphohydrolase
MARVVVASSNRGKLRELRVTLAGLGVELVAQGELGVQPAPECAVTFVENALSKARHAAREAGLPAIADDSGLVVPALGGAPGIRSARYAGEPPDDAANNAKLQAALGGVEDRAAFFYCALVYIGSAEDPAPLIATGRWDGRIIDQPRGDNGFGYDPCFLIPNLGSTAAELTAEEKNRLSHRGQASRALAALLAR